MNDNILEQLRSLIGVVNSGGWSSSKYTHIIRTNDGDEVREEVVRYPIGTTPIKAFFNNAEPEDPNNAEIYAKESDVTDPAEIEDMRQDIINQNEHDKKFYDPKNWTIFASNENFALIKSKIGEIGNYPRYVIVVAKQFIDQHKDEDKEWWLNLVINSLKQERRTGFIAGVI